MWSWARHEAAAPGRVALYGSCVWVMAMFQQLSGCSGMLVESCALCCCFCCCCCCCCCKCRWTGADTNLMHALTDVWLDTPSKQSVTHVSDSMKWGWCQAGALCSPCALQAVGCHSGRASLPEGMPGLFSGEVLPHVAWDSTQTGHTQ
jgi:hypothetical protein